MNDTLGIIIVIAAATVPPIVSRFLTKRTRDHWMRAARLYKEGVELAGRHCFPEAQAAFEQAVHDMSVALPPHRPEHLPYLHALAQVHCQQGHFVEARQLCRRTLNRADSTISLDVELPLLETLGASCYGLGTPSDLAEAEVAFQRALARAGERPGADLASYLDRLGSIHALRGNYAAAEQELSRAIDLRRGERAQPYMLARTLHRLGAVREEQGRCTEARALHQEALFITMEAITIGKQPPAHLHIARPTRKRIRGPC